MNYLKSVFVILLKTSFSIFFNSTLLFILLRIAPGDPGDAILGSGTYQITSELLREKLEVNEPLLKQYLSYIKNILQLNLGQSISNEEPVLNIILKSFPATIELLLAGWILSLALQNIIKKFASCSFINYYKSIVSSLPGFWAAMIAQLIFSVHFNTSPTGLKDSLYNLVLPAFILGLILSASNKWWIILLIEVTFSWPGIALRLHEAISQRDYTLVQGIVLFTITFVFLVTEISNTIKLKQPEIINPCNTTMSTKFGFIIICGYLLITLIMKFLEANNFFGWSFSILSNDIFAPPSLNHFCGTDRLGRDVCIRILQGVNLTVDVSIATLFFAIFSSLFILIIASFFPKISSTIIFTNKLIPNSFLMDVVIAFVLGKGILNASLTLCVYPIKELIEVLATNKLLGISIEELQKKETMLKIGKLFLQSLPSLSKNLILRLTSLGFLGLGVPSDVPEWGSDLNLALAALPTGIWWTAIFPGLAAWILCIGLSFLISTHQKKNLILS